MHCLEAIVKMNEEALKQHREALEQRKPMEPQPSESVVWSTLIPMHDNDGNPLSGETLNALLETAVRYFGGYTLDAVSQGVHVDSDGKRFEDLTRRLTVACKHEKLCDARAFVKWVCYILRQECVIFFVDGKAEFINLDTATTRELERKLEPVDCEKPHVDVAEPPQAPWRLSCQYYDQWGNLRTRE